LLELERIPRSRRLRHLYPLRSLSAKGYVSRGQDQCGTIGALKYLGPDIAVVEIGEMAPTGVWYQMRRMSEETSL
jgi:hypothetical protein